MKFIFLIIFFSLIFSPANNYPQISEKNKNDDQQPSLFEKVEIPEKFKSRLLSEKKDKKNFAEMTQSEKIIWTFRLMKRPVLL